MLKDYEFVEVWEKYSNGRTSSLSDEAIKIKQGKQFIYIVPDGEKDYNECIRHYNKILHQEEFDRQYSLIKMFP